MQMNPKTAKILFSAYAVIIAVLFSFWMYYENSIFIILSNILLMLLYIWIFVKTPYFISLLKGNGNVNSREVTLTRIFLAIVFCSGCYVTYINVMWL